MAGLARQERFVASAVEGWQLVLNVARTGGPPARALLIRAVASIEIVQGVAPSRTDFILADAAAHDLRWFTSQWIHDYR